MTIRSTIRHHAARPLWLLLMLAGLAAPPVSAQDDWPAWGRDGGNQRHSPLTQIDTGNVSTLVPAWRFEMTQPGVPSRPSQSTPLIVDGVLYLSFPYYRVVALEPETGGRHLGLHGARGLELAGAPVALDGWVDAGAGPGGKATTPRPRRSCSERRRASSSR